MPKGNRRTDMNTNQGVHQTHTEQTWRSNSLAHSLPTHTHTHKFQKQESSNRFPSKDITMSKCSLCTSECLCVSLFKYSKKERNKASKRERYKSCYKHTPFCAALLLIKMSSLTLTEFRADLQCCLSTSLLDEAGSVSICESGKVTWCVFSTSALKKKLKIYKSFLSLFSVNSILAHMMSCVQTNINYVGRHPCDHPCITLVNMRLEKIKSSVTRYSRHYVWGRPWI